MVTKEYKFPEFTEGMYEQLDKWWHSHNYGKCCNRTYGAIDGVIEFRICPTAIGNIVLAECSCGESILLQ